jgi:hypothetical protein
LSQTGRDLHGLTSSCRGAILATLAVPIVQGICAIVQVISNQHTVMKHIGISSFHLFLCWMISQRRLKSGWRFLGLNAALDSIHFKEPRYAVLPMAVDVCHAGCSEEVYLSEMVLYLIGFPASLKPHAYDIPMFKHTSIYQSRSLRVYVARVRVRCPGKRWQKNR